tara:strand:+ start:578 stop:763 length:186 start_codon:yes stop_codon:yes gene_type:complete
MMNIDQMRDALTEDEIEHIQSLSGRNLFHYVRETIILKHSDDEVRELYYYTIEEADDDERD